MKTFHLYRDHDVSGVSGTGVVADGVVFPDGATVIRWRGERQSTVVWPSIEDVEAIHGHGGATRIVWGTPMERTDGETPAAVLTLTVDLFVEHVPGTSDPSHGYEPAYDFPVIRNVEGTAVVDPAQEDRVRFLVDVSDGDLIDPDNLMVSAVRDLLAPR